MKVIDDPDFIIIRCDSINMFMHLLRAGIKIPETRFVEKKELDRRTMESLFEELGTPLILNAPHA